MKTFKHKYSFGEICGGLKVLIEEMQKPPFNYQLLWHESVENLARYIITKLSEDREASILLGEIKLNPPVPVRNKHNYTMQLYIGRGHYHRYQTNIGSISVFLSYPEFQLPDIETYELTPLAHASPDDFNAILNQHFSPHGNILLLSFEANTYTMDVYPKDLYDFFGSKAVQKDFAVFNKMQEGTPEAIIDGLRIYGAPESAIIKYKLKNGYIVDPSEVDDETMMDLL